MRLGLLVRQGSGFSGGSHLILDLKGWLILGEVQPLNAANLEWIKCEENCGYE